MGLLSRMGVPKPGVMVREALLAAARLTPARGVPVLCYHKIADGVAAERHPLAVPRRRFEAQMEYLARAGWATIPAAEVLAPAPPRRAFALTFDDAHADALELAAPILAQHGFRATVFPVTEWIGTEGWLDHRNGNRLDSPRDPADLPTRFLGWDELRALQEMGWEIGAHTCRHLPLLDLPPAERRRELAEAKQLLEAELGTPVTLFAYPLRSFSREVADEARAAGYRLAFSLEPGLNGPSVDAMRVRRAAVRGWHDLRDLELRLTPMYPLFRRVAGAVERQSQDGRSMHVPHSDNSMKILWVMKKYLDVSVDKSTGIEVTRSLRRLGHDARLLTAYKHAASDYGLPGAIEYAPSVRLPVLNHLTFLAGASARLARHLVTWRPDVVLMDAHTCLVAWPWHLARRMGLLKTAFVLDIRSIPVECRGTLGRLEERLFDVAVRYARRWMDGITVISPFMARTLAEQYELDARQMGVWSSGVALDHFDPARFPAPETAALRCELGLEGRYVLLYHGTLEPHRGLATAIRGLAALGDAAADVALLIVGRGSALPELRREAVELELADRVVFREAVPYAEVPRYVAAADAGMLPLPDLMWWRVSSPIKLMEFLAMGKPALVTEIEAHGDLLGDAPFAFYAGRGAVEEWAEGLLRLRQALVERPDLAGDARTFAARSLTWDHQAEKLCGYLAGVHARRPAWSRVESQASRVEGEGLDMLPAGHPTPAVDPRPLTLDS